MLLATVNLSRLQLELLLLLFPLKPIVHPLPLRSNLPLTFSFLLIIPALPVVTSPAFHDMICSLKSIISSF